MLLINCIFMLISLRFSLFWKKKSVWIRSENEKKKKEVKKKRVREKYIYSKKLLLGYIEIHKDKFLFTYLDEWKRNWK